MIKGRSLHDPSAPPGRSKIEHRVARIDGAWSVGPDLLGLPWETIPALPALVLADGSGPAEQRTVVRACAGPERFLVHFQCDDDDIWGTYSKRDDPIYLEEAVEVFLARGGDDPVEYYEFELSPNGVLFDARVRNPTSRREDLLTDARWDCPGIRYAASIGPARTGWTAALEIPWEAIGARSGPPPLCRGNFYRIERPRGRKPELSAWSPTHAHPADFHKPLCFGRLVMEDKERA